VERGYRFASLDDVLSGAAGERAVAVTFDDGYAHLCEHLPSFLDEFGLRPTVFIPTHYIGRTNAWDYTRMIRTDTHLDRAQIAEFAGLGVEFGTHGHSHTGLTDLPDDRLAEELIPPRRILEDILGFPVTKISYPFGRSDHRIVTAARQAGYTHGFTTCFPRSDDDPLETGRYGVWFFDDALSVVRRLEPGSWAHPVERAKAALARRLSGGTRLFNRLVHAAGRR
jgi:peptidoglycan/xylan/chitin deacetylase (PgdA/CDA1 family)